LSQTTVHCDAFIASHSCTLDILCSFYLSEDWRAGQSMQGICTTINKKVLYYKKGFVRL